MKDMALLTDPFWICFFELILFLAFFSPMMKGHRFDGRRAFLLVLLALLWCAVHVLRLDFVWDALANIALLTLYLFSAENDSGKCALYHACVFVLCAEIGKLLALNYCLQPLHAALDAFPSFAITCVYALLYLLFVALGLMLAGRWVKRDALDGLKWSQVACILLPFVPYAFIRSSNLSYDVSDVSQYYTMSFILLVLGLCTLAVIVANAHSLSSEAERSGVLLMQDLVRRHHLQLLAQKQAGDAINRRYHDLKHYLSALEVLLRDSTDKSKDSALAFLESVRREIEPYEVTIATGNDMLDVLLSEKRAECLKCGLRPVFSVDGSRLGFMSEFDICAVFGNMLDNAIESAAQAHVDGLSDIVLDVYNKNDLVVIECSNCCHEVVRGVDGNPVTQKARQDGHGQGFKSIRSVVDRYGGGLSWIVEDGVFLLSLVLPIPSPSCANTAKSSVF